MLECFSVFLTEDSSSNAEVQELVLDDQSLGTTLTAITLPDGSQAFVTGHIQGNGLYSIRSYFKIIFFKFPCED